MSKHILLENATRYIAPVTIPMPENCFFNSRRGYWINSDGIAMMHSNDPQKPQTKKMDIETGEDAKGE